jgi:hypothetical protein
MRVKPFRLKNESVEHEYDRWFDIADVRLKMRITATPSGSGQYVGVDASTCTT